MSHPAKCPVCGGSGQVPDPDMAECTVPALKTCHGCGGKGWVSLTCFESTEELLADLGASDIKFCPYCGEKLEAKQ